MPVTFPADERRQAEFARRVFALLGEVYGVDGTLVDEGTVHVSYEGAQITSDPAQYVGSGRWVQEQDRTVRWQVTLRFSTTNTSVSEIQNPDVVSGLGGKSTPIYMDKE